MMQMARQSERGFSCVDHQNNTLVCSVGYERFITIALNSPLLLYSVHIAGGECELRFKRISLLNSTDKI